MEQEELTRREDELQMRESRLLAQEALTKRGLPSELLAALPLGDPSALESALDGVEAAVKQAADKAVAERLKGREPVLGGAESGRQAALRRAFGLK